MEEGKEKKCIETWKILHDGKYFERHPHYVNYILDADDIVGSIKNYVGVFRNDIALDIGCGYGRIMYSIANLVDSVIGIDVHEEPLARARDILKGKPNAKVILSDGCSIPLPDKSVTLVYAFSVMQHLPRSIVIKYINESIRACKPSGRICLQFLNKQYGGECDIDSERIYEQSVGWTSEELADAVAGTGASFEINSYPLILYGVVQ